MKVKYIGPITGGVEIAATGDIVEQGETVDLADPIAIALCEQTTNWEPADPAAKKTLGGNAMVRAMAPWLVPDADVVVFVGVGQLLGAARQIAESLPGGSVEMVPAAPEGLEPVAAAVRSKDATWESALVLPSGVLGVAFDAAKARARQ